MSFAERLGIIPGITPILGGGGKTTLMLTLARELAARGGVIVCTSTKIYPPEFCPVVQRPRAVKRGEILCVGTPGPEGKLLSPEGGFAELSKLAAFVLVEADGSRGLPLKAHAPWEPVIPEGSGPNVYVVGADAFGQPVRRVCHRAERFAELAGCDLETIVTPELAARALLAEGLAERLFVNKIESPVDLENARRLRAACALPTVGGSLRSGVCLL